MKENNSIEKQEVVQEITETNSLGNTPELPNLCQGYLVDPLTKLHLCTACEYHKYRNESKPLLK